MLVLGQGSSADVAFQPDASKPIVKTLVGETRIVTSARHLILAECDEGRVEILMSNGRVIAVERGKADAEGAQRLHPTDGGLGAELCDLYARIGLGNRVMEQYRQVLRREPDHLGARQGLASVRAGAGL